ncbi:hypothetical protein AAH978_08075 [Streptomyces sp. ZYX-F-203]
MRVLQVSITATSIPAASTNQALGSGRHLPVAVTHPEPDADPALVHEPTGSGRRGDLDGDLARPLDHFDPGHRGPLRGLDLGTAGPYS